jgi:hypothetical protein
MSQTKVAVGMLNATGTPGSGNFLRGDGTWNSAGGLTFISNTDISSASTYDFTGFTAGSYEHYQLVLQNLIPATDAVHLWGRTSTDATNYDSGSSDYQWGGQGGNETSTTDTSDAQIELIGDSSAVTIGSDSTESGVSGFVWIFGPHTTSFTHIRSVLSYQNTSPYFGTANSAGVRMSAADVDGFRIMFSSGNIESGTITAYGLANA